MRKSPEAKGVGKDTTNPPNSSYAGRGQPGGAGARLRHAMGKRDEPNVYISYTKVHKNTLNEAL